MAIEGSGSPDAGMEKIIRDLSPHLASTLGSLGYKRLGLDKDDLLQEIYIRIWKSLRGQNHDIHYFNAYLRKIVYSVFINEINRVNKEKEALETAGPCLSPYEGTNDSCLSDDAILKTTLVASINGLKESKQRVLKLRLQGFTLDEIARLNQWPYRKTCSIFYRGLKELKRKLGEKGIHYEDEAG
jgi:RNA polymerase sigma factor (sigma-70 family)